MLFSARGLARSSFGVSVALYAAGIVLATAVTVLGAHRVVTTIASELVPAKDTVSAAVAAPKPKSGPASRQTADLSQTRQAYMTPLHAGFASIAKEFRGPASQAVVPAFFGSSSRFWGRSGRRDRDEDDDDDDEDRRERARESGTYRTLCVRLCDGYYFPISFSVTPDRFTRDAKVCESSCGGQARLFVYRNPGADVEDMVDLRGQPYRQLTTAFLYRTEYVPACRCKPNPWDAEALERHRVYALAAAKRKGSKQAAAELAALTLKAKRERQPKSSKAAQAVVPPVAVAPPPLSNAVESPPSPDAGKPAAAPAARPNRGDDKVGRMALGARPARTTRERPTRSSSRTPEWMVRALGRPF